MYLQFCTCVEDYKDGVHTYTFTGPCKKTGRPFSITVLGPDLFRYNQGAMIQDAFPYLTPAEREFIITGYSPEGWKEIFG